MDIGFPIDFVVTWVNGEDPVWLAKKNEVIQKSKREDEFTSENRYRDLGLFNYWFRSIEKFAPWVNHIYLVTDQQVPDFLNVRNEKVTVVDHKDIIDEQFLPTYNSNTIDLNLHRIPNLHEHFVYFNDDIYLNAPTSPLDFFSKDGIPRDTVAQSVIIPTESYDHCLVNNVILLNSNFKKKQVIKDNFGNFFSLKQGIECVFLNLYFSIFPKFTRLYDPHTAFSLLKSEMNKALKKAEIITNETFFNKQRNINDISIQWIRYYLIGNGKVKPRSPKVSKAAQSCEIEKVENILFQKKNLFLILQDDMRLTDKHKEKLNLMFMKKFKEKSSFEK
ncbi:stealth family protein [Enterococcus asini]|uniref:Stealth family protein n=1 Tax=Enterococcus asini TaxID=57732 RepID=A0AAW8U2F5_9ENTE|nr:stealth family protein [Enterococcus asini]MDT2811260.1 stealth family protein [Enterococcus asini]